MASHNHYLIFAESTGKPIGDTVFGGNATRPGVLVTAFAKNPDGLETLLRVWEQAGVSDKLTITLPKRFIKATPINLRAEKIGTSLAISDGEFSIDLHAYAPASFLIE